MSASADARRTVSSRCISSTTASTTGAFTRPRGVGLSIAYWSVESKVPTVKVAPD